MASDRVEFLTGVVGEGWWADITLTSVREALGSGDVTLVLHTLGGDAGAGMAIAGAIARHKGRVRIEIDGLAASAGSAIAVAGDELVMAPGAMLMIHEPWGLAIGTKDDMLQVARTLEKFTDAYADYYAAHTPMTKKQAKEYMAAETWFTAEMAAEIGLAKRETTGRKKPADPMKERERKDDDERMSADVAAQLWHGIAALYEGAEKQGLTTQPPASTVSAKNMRKHRFLDAGGASATAPAGTAAPAATATAPEPVKPPVDAPFTEVELTDGTPCYMVPQAQWAEAKAEITKLTEMVGEQQETINAMNQEKLDGKVETLLAAATADGRITGDEYNVWKDRLNRDFDAMAAVIEGLKPNLMYRVNGSTNLANGEGSQVLSAARRRALSDAGWTDERISAYAKSVSQGAAIGGVR